MWLPAKKKKLVLLFKGNKVVDPIFTRGHIRSVDNLIIYWPFHAEKLGGQKLTTVTVNLHFPQAHLYAIRPALPNANGWGPPCSKCTLVSPACNCRLRNKGRSDSDYLPFMLGSHFCQAANALLRGCCVALKAAGWGRKEHKMGCWGVERKEGEELWLVRKQQRRPEIYTENVGAELGGPRH